MATCGADTEANALLIALSQDAQFPIPDVDLSGDDFKFPPGLLQNSPIPLEPKDITDATIDGPGVFDVLMRGFKTHLQREWDDGRITGDDYTKAYITLTEAAMSQGISFLLGKDQAYWSALSAQVQAYIARTQLEVTKLTVAATQYDAANRKATYGLTKMQIANQEMTYCTGKFNLEQLLPLDQAGRVISNDTATYNLATVLPGDVALTGSRKQGQDTENSISGYNLANILPAQLGFQTAQTAGQEIANDTATYNLSTRLPREVENLGLQGNMLKEQTEAQRAQTLDTRLDGATVVGVLGKQKDLYAQQITSYQRDAEMKAARLWSDAWITQKTIDEGLDAPTQFTNTNVDAVLADIRLKNNLA